MPGHHRVSVDERSRVNAPTRLAEVSLLDYALKRSRPAADGGHLTEIVFSRVSRLLSAGWGDVICPPETIAAATNRARNGGRPPDLA
jgi:hypothetical protein